MNSLNSTLAINSTIDAGEDDLSQQQQSYMDYFHPKFPKFLTIVFLIFGDFGNILSLVVFSSKTMRNHSVFTYFAFLSIVDFFVVTLGLGDIIIISYFGIALRNESLIMCRVHTFFTYLSTHLSSFILASVSIDRAIALNFFKFAKKYCKPKNARKIILFNCVLVIAVNFHSLLFLGFYINNNDSQSNDQNEALNSSNSSMDYSMELSCASREGSIYFSFLESYFKYIDLICYAILPFLIMSVCTIMIVRVLIKSNDSLLGKSSHALIMKKKRNKHVTYSLIILNILFLCLVSPLVVVYATNPDVIDNKIIYNITYLLAYGNHCFNFIFYGLSCPPYRHVIKSFLGFKRN